MENQDQGSTEIVEKDNQSDETQSKDTDNKEPAVTLDKVSELTSALQKGYTLTRQELSELKDSLSQITEKLNQQSGAKEGEDEYLTVGKLREILTQQNQVQSEAKEQQQRKINNYIESSIADLTAKGVIKEIDKEDLMKFAIKIKEADLFRAADIFNEIKQAREEGKKELVKIKVKQEEGSKVGTSSKTGEEQEGLSYSKIKRGGWFNF
jgi:hypothetical protein